MIRKALLLLLFIAGEFVFSQPYPSPDDKIFEEFEKKVILYRELNLELGQAEENRDKIYEDRNASKAALIQWAMENWRVLLSDTDRLPDFPGFLNREGVVMTIAIAGGGLPPLEYLDLVDRLLELGETKKVSEETACHPFLAPPDQKDFFFQVNYEYPKVRKLLERAKALLVNRPQSIPMIDETLSGELADEYMDPNNRSADAPYPETLPGIKLKRPFGKLRAQAERLLGKQLPRDEYDARWEEYDRQWRANHERRKAGDVGSPQLEPPELYEIASSWLWLIGGLIVVIFAFGFWGMKRLRHRK